MHCPICNRPQGFRCVMRNVWQRVWFILSNPRISWWIIAKIYPSQQKARPATKSVRPRYGILQLVSNKIFNHCIHYDRELAYRRWQQAYETIPFLPLPNAPTSPSFLFIVKQSQISSNVLSQFIASVEQQTWTQRAMRIVPQDTQFEQWLQETALHTRYEYICLVESDFVLSIRALEWMVQFWPTQAPMAVFGDNDCLTMQGKRHSACFKPQWDSILQQNSNYTAPFVAFSKQAIINGKSLNTINSQTLLHQLANTADAAIFRVPRILSHLPDGGQQQAVYYFNDTVRCSITGTHYFHCQANSATQAAKISIIIPTKDAVELLRNCVTSILKSTTELDFEILIINNNSQRKETIEYFAEIVQIHNNIRVIDYNLPFNYSDMNNKAVEQASGAVLCFVNNDIELLTTDGLQQMLQFAVMQNIGAVGITLYYPNQTIQHAGVCLGLGGIAGHLLRGLPRNDMQHALYTKVTRQVSAVTAAFLMVRRDVFQAVGGFDAENLAVAYNDVDLCLKIQELGLKNIYLSQVEALHFESASRASDFSAKQSKRYIAEGSFFQQKWQYCIDNEVFYNPNLGREREDMRIVL